MQFHSIPKPELRNPLRKFLGKEFFILKRKRNWFLNKRGFASIDTKSEFNNSLNKENLNELQ